MSCQNIQRQCTDQRGHQAMYAHAQANAESPEESSGDAQASQPRRSWRGGVQVGGLLLLAATLVAVALAWAGAAPPKRGTSVESQFSLRNVISKAEADLAIEEAETESAKALADLEDEAPEALDEENGTGTFDITDRTIIVSFTIGGADFGKLTEQRILVVLVPAVEDAVAGVLGKAAADFGRTNLAKNGDKVRVATKFLPTDDASAKEVWATCVGADDAEVDIKATLSEVDGIEDCKANSSDIVVANFTCLKNPLGWR